MFDETLLLDEIDYLPEITKKNPGIGIEVLRASIAKPVQELYCSSLVRGVHRMRIMRSLYEYASCHAKSVGVLAGNVVKINYDDHVTKALGKYKDIIGDNPFAPLISSLQNGEQQYIETYQGAYPWWGNMFANGLYCLAYHEKNEIEEFLVLSCMDERVFLRLIDKRMLFSAMPPLSLSDGTYSLPLVKDSFLPKITLSPLPDMLTASQMNKDTAKMLAMLGFD